MSSFERVKKPTTLRNAILLLVGIVFILFGSLLQEYLPYWTSTSVQTIGIVLVSMLIGHWIHDWFGGNPDLEALKEAVTEFKLGCDARQSGVTRIYKKRSDAKDDVLADIKASERSCRIYAAVYFSEIYKDDDFPKALIAAAKNAQNKNTVFLLSYCSMDPNCSSNPSANYRNNALILDMWAQREGDPDVGDLRSRITRAHNMFERIASKVTDECRSINVVPRYFVNYMVPHCMIILDDHVVYLALYDWANERGDHAPTLRLVDGYWAEVFVREANALDERYSTLANYTS